MAWSRPELVSWGDLGLVDKPRILCIGPPSADDAETISRLRLTYEVVEAPSPLRALSRLTNESFACVYFFGDSQRDALKLARFTQSERIVDGLPDAVALLDPDNRILWANDRLREWAVGESVEGVNFYEVFCGAEIVGPDFCPFQTALVTCEPSSSTLRVGDHQYYKVHAAPVREPGQPIQHLIVTVRDITEDVAQNQKLVAIHNAGLELTDLTPEEVFEMEIDERIELLKENILRNTMDLLSFDVVEIRLLEQKTNSLVPLLAAGMTDDAVDRALFASPQNNGVTGFVAATGKSYLCEDTNEDPLYLKGSDGARSSLTVPLIQHDEVIGTFNVESPSRGAFSESDLQFLEIFSRDVARALTTLELLVAQQANTALASVEAIHGEVALPVDEILNDAVNVMEDYIGVKPEVSQRLQRILRNARDIKQVIHKVGEQMTPAEAIPPSLDKSAWPRLKGRRILVVDSDESVRVAAHNLLERFGCIVETAHTGDEATLMVRNSVSDAAYDVIIADVRLPDFSGYDLLIKLKDVLSLVPLVLMTGYGYDPGHSIVKARQAGMLPNAVLFKPFRLDQLLSTVDSVVEAANPQPS